LYELSRIHGARWCVSVRTRRLGSQTPLVGMGCGRVACGCIACGRPTQSTPGGYPTPQMTNQQLEKLSGWLAFLRHAQACISPTCTGFGGRCLDGKGLIKHLLGCADPRCTQRHCQNAKKLLCHHFSCIDRNCPVCSPVVEYHSQLSARAIFGDKVC